MANLESGHCFLERRLEESIDGDGGDDQHWNAHSCCHLYRAGAVEVKSSEQFAMVAIEVGSEGSRSERA